MKKLFICVSAVITAGLVYWLFKNEESKVVSSQTESKQADLKTNTQGEKNAQSAGAVDEIHQAKNEIAQAIYERHAEAGSIMKDSYSTIMEDFSDPKSTIENKDIAIESEPNETMKKIDSISDELDSLLK